MAKPDGGPAYPKQCTIADANDPMFKWGSSGMTLRDYFAGQALAGLLANPTLDITNESGDGLADSDIVAKACFYFADAMLAEREKTGPSASSTSEHYSQSSES